MPRGIDRIRQEKGKDREGPKPLDLSRPPQHFDSTNPKDTAYNAKQKYSNQQEQHENEYLQLKKDTEQFESNLNLRSRLANALRKHPNDTEIRSALKLYISSKNEVDKFTSETEIKLHTSSKTRIIRKEEEISDILENSSFGPKKKLKEIHRLAGEIKQEIDMTQQEKLLVFSLYKRDLTKIVKVLDSKQTPEGSLSPEVKSEELPELLSSQTLSDSMTLPSNSPGRIESQASGS